MFIKIVRMEQNTKIKQKIFTSGSFQSTHLPSNFFREASFISFVRTLLLIVFHVWYPKEEEKKYNFSTPSTMKPTQIECAKGAINQLPPWTTISGDIRLTPFYDVGVVYRQMETWVQIVIGFLTFTSTCTSTCSSNHFDFPVTLSTEYFLPDAGSI